LQTGELLEAGLLPNPLIARHLLTVHRHRHNLVAEPSAVGRASRALLTLEAERIDLLTRNVVAIAQHLRADPLVELDVVVARPHPWPEWLPGALSIRPHGPTRHALAAARDR